MSSIYVYDQASVSRSFAHLILGVCFKFVTFIHRNNIHWNINM